MVSLKVKGVDCYYYSDQILKDIEFTADEGDFIGILGPNGAGKTTLLKTLSRTLKPRVGTVFLEEQDLYEMSPKEVGKKIGVIPQISETSFNFSCFEIVLMGRNPHISRFQGETTSDVKIAERAMETAGITHLSDRSILEISGGERQRVIIARALAQNPEILMLDEPTLHLDISKQLSILDLLGRLCESDNLLVISVFHDLNLASKYCKKLILLSNKKISSMGRPEEVLTKDNISRVYGIESIIKRHPITDSLYLIPISRDGGVTSNARKFRVHIICGGGTGGYLIRTLLNKRFQVSCGVLNVLDSDYEIADDLNAEIIREAPFSPITQNSYEENLRKIQQSDIVVMTNFSVGSGNLRNLEAAKFAIENKKKMLIVNTTPISERDFAAGLATKYYSELINLGASVVRSNREALNTIESLAEGR